MLCMLVHMHFRVHINRNCSRAINDVLTIKHAQDLSNTTTSGYRRYIKEREKNTVLDFTAKTMRNTENVHIVLSSLD